MKIKLPKKQWIILGVLGVVLIGGGFWAYKAFSPKAVIATTVTGKVVRGDVSKVITATGTVSYPTLVNLTFVQTEKLVAKNVAVGDHVTAGQILMQIDPSNLQQTVNQQQANLASAQAKLQQAQEDSLPNAMTALQQAQESLNTKQTALTTAKNNADSAYLTNQVNLANQNVTLASNTLAQVMASGDNSKIQSAQTALAQAQQALTTAQTAQNGGAAQTLNVAQSAFDVAQQNLNLAQDKVNKLQQGKTSADILSAQTAVEQAQAQLETAQTNLGKATMVAPFDGVITAVTGQVGQVMESTSTTSSKPGVTLAANPDILQIDTTVGQADVNNIKVGQKAEITLDTQANTKIPGTVSAIAVQGTTASNVTTFGVTVTVDQTGTILKAGMNANVNIILDQAKNVLTIPSEALKTDNGKNYVLIPNASGGAASSAGTGAGSASSSRTKKSSAAGNNANTSSVPVEIGLNDGSNVEIKSGLSEGQEIVLSVSAASTTTSTQKSGSSTSSRSGGADMGALNRATSTGGGPRPGN
ncbi:efflux RND transporter periplasmic adaptor subunit [Desulfitobacterium sp.]|uniref:efflux RND transporter periplasmic adaptor subunit n=1 Tax=Desulfitobacterium sp. TaxID=49981 RepID=UPI002C8E096E|nr:HlyD family efflux transporter periplasmic adaptor subunit [Desulfitobacterium sp.]HVJ50803.1 HlyD family efflux transporter periplasmic adaptor subunit [Desulfitobacterium sp.]